MKDIETVVSENIQKLMDEHNLSNVKLAKIAGVSESTVGKWVLKKATPRMGAIQKISDHFNIPKSYILNEDEKQVLKIPTREYNFLPLTISAGLPINVDGITDADKISIPDAMMGKWAANKDILFTRISGDSMNNKMSDGSLIAIKEMDNVESLKDGDMVVFSHNHEYSVKYFYKTDDKLIFKPDSTNKAHHEQHFNIDDGVQIHGKVVLYIVEMD